MELLRSRPLTTAHDVQAFFDHITMHYAECARFRVVATVSLNINTTRQVSSMFFMTGRCTASDIAACVMFVSSCTHAATYQIEVHGSMLVKSIFPPCGNYMTALAAAIRSKLALFYDADVANSQIMDEHTRRQHQLQQTLNMSLLTRASMRRAILSIWLERSTWPPPCVGCMASQQNFTDAMVYRKATSSKAVHTYRRSITSTWPSVLCCMECSEVMAYRIIMYHLSQVQHTPFVTQVSQCVATNLPCEYLRWTCSHVESHPDHGVDAFRALQQQESGVVDEYDDEDVEMDTGVVAAGSNDDLQEEAQDDDDDDDEDEDLDSVMQALDRLADGSGVFHVAHMSRLRYVQPPRLHVHFADTPCMLSALMVLYEIARQWPMSGVSVLPDSKTVYFTVHCDSALTPIHMRWHVDEGRLLHMTPMAMHTNIACSNNIYHDLGRAVRSHYSTILNEDDDDDDDDHENDEFTLARPVKHLYALSSADIAAGRVLDPLPSVFMETKHALAPSSLEANYPVVDPSYLTSTTTTTTSSRGQEAQERTQHVMHSTLSHTEMVRKINSITNTLASARQYYSSSSLCSVRHSTTTSTT